ncbi:MAG: DUF3857 domain-containing protein [Candidatus Accumulibacter sp. UW26]
MFLTVLTALALGAPGALALDQLSPAETPLKEIEVAPEHFVRGTPVPDWADLLPLPTAVSGGKAPVVVRLSDSHLRVGPPNVAVLNRAIQVNDASALGLIGQTELPFHPQFQTLRLHKLVIQRGEQTIDHTLTASIRFLQREIDLEKGVYSGVITASIVLPDVRVGDTLHIVLSEEGGNPIFGARFAERAVWDLPAPVDLRLRRVTLLAPKEREIQWRWIGGLTAEGPRPQQTLEGGMRRLRFEGRDLAGVDIEPGTPPHVQQLRSLQFTEYHDWNQVALWALGLFPLDAPLPDEMTPVMRRLRALENSDEKVSQALQWVQSEIRNWSIALGENSHRPQPPAEVLKRRYGDCKDKALLLVRMLSELGIEARPVMVSLSTRKGPSLVLPTPDAFDHVIVQVKLGGREFFVDPTRLGQTGLLARMGQVFEDAMVLPIDVKTRGLVTIHSPNRAEIFARELSERFTLPSFDGEATLEQTLRLTGVIAEVLRVMIPRYDAAQLRQIVLGDYERRYPGIRVIGEPKVTDDQRLNQLTLQTRFVIPKLAQESDGNWGMQFLPQTLITKFVLPPSTGRRFPVFRPDHPDTDTYSVEMVWPAVVAAAHDPAAQKLETPHFQLETTRSFRGNVDRRTVRFVPLGSEIPAAELPRLQEDLRKLSTQVGGVMVVAKSEISTNRTPGSGLNLVLDNRRKRDQAQIERADKAIATGSLSGEDLAATLCSRANARRNLLGSAPTEVLQDAQDAVKAAELSSVGWSCLGNALFVRGEFTKAAQAYSRALPLSDEPAHTYYRRGHARFYEGKLAEAADDFAQSAASYPDESARLYAQLWQAWTLLRLGKPLPTDLAVTAAREPRGAWPRPALAMLAGLLTVDEVLAEVQRKQGDERELDLVEAWFYIGQYHLLHERQTQAREAFETVIDKGVTFYIEHNAAGFELQRLGSAH